MKLNVEKIKNKEKSKAGKRIWQKRKKDKRKKEREYVRKKLKI